MTTAFDSMERSANFMSDVIVIKRMQHVMEDCSFIWQLYMYFLFAVLCYLFSGTKLQ